MISIGFSISIRVSIVGNFQHGPIDEVMSQILILNKKEIANSRSFTKGRRRNKRTCSDYNDCYGVKCKFISFCVGMP